MYETITEQAHRATGELLEAAGLRVGQVLVAGCSSSEMVGEKIGTHSSEEAARALLNGIYPLLLEHGIFLAAQCCEHLNRALIVEREAAERYGWEIVNAVPQPKAGGSFATAAYAAFRDPVAVEKIQADAGMDIGNTLIGMHLRRVAVPLRLSIKRIGEAPLVCARTRPKFIGGERAHYRKDLL